MPLNITGEATPQPIEVQELPPPPIRAVQPAAAQAPAVAPQPLNINAQALQPAGQLPQVTPQQIGVTAQSIKETTPFLGFRLALVVLGITAGSILALSIYLLFMDWVIAHDVREAYHDVMNPDRVGAQYLAVAQLQKLTDDLENSRKNPSTPWSAEASDNGAKVVAQLIQLPALTTAQRGQIQNCVPPPPANDAARDSKIGDCLVLVGAVKQATLQAVAAGTDSRVAADSSSKIAEQRENLHKFWIQAAQLILLNLLLPLLTALFGYIFGTQQGQQRQSSS